MRQIIYTLDRSRTSPEPQIDLSSHESEISTILGLFFVPWENEYYGSKNGNKIHLKHDGNLILSGEIRGEVEEISNQIVINEIFAAEIEYNDPNIRSVELRQDVNASIENIISTEITDIVRTNISADYNIKDVSLLFESIETDRILTIKFEKSRYTTGDAEVPLKVSIISDSEATCLAVLEELRARLEMEIIE